ncbi:MAG: hypothetical protein AABZ64_02560, partial [Nitrospinota bacterium]
MPSVAAVSTGEILDKVMTAPAARESGPGGERGSFEDALAGASQDLGAGAVAPAANPGKPSKAQGPAADDPAPVKGQAPDQSVPKKENTPPEESTADGKSPASAASAEGRTKGPAEPAGEGGEVVSADDGGSALTEEELALIVA